MKFEEVIDKINGKSSLKRSAKISDIQRYDSDDATVKQELKKVEKKFVDNKRVLQELAISNNDSKRFDEQYILKRIIVALMLLEKDNKISAKQTDIIAKLNNFSKYLDGGEKYFIFKNNEEVIFNTVLEVILEDGRISFDEAKIIEKLRNKLQITTYKFWFLLKKLNKIPLFIKSFSNKEHSLLENQFKDLEFQGIVFNIKDEGEEYFIIPSEIAKTLRTDPTLRKMVGVELSTKNYLELLNHTLINNSAKRNFLKSQELLEKGSNEDLNNRIIYNQLTPFSFLDSLSNKILRKILVRENEKTSGSKPERITRIIERFDAIDTSFNEEKIDSREKLFKYYVHLAERNTAELLKTKICSREAEIGKLFEKATNFLFEKKLGCKLKEITIKGNERNVRADGSATQDKKYVLFWDCKTKSKLFQFNTNEERQFKHYIEEYKKSNKDFSFLIITPEIKDKTEVLKHLTNIKISTGIDINVIIAKDLEKFAQHITKTGDEFNLRIFSGKPMLDFTYLKSLTYTK